MSRCIHLVGALALTAMLASSCGRMTGEYPESTHVQSLTASGFETEVTQAAVPVLVDFYATWCGPCKMQAPILDRLAGEYEGKVKFLKVDVDKEPRLAQQFKVQSIPTLIVFHKGEVVEQFVGLTREETLKVRLNALSSSTPPSAN